MKNCLKYVLTLAGILMIGLGVRTGAYEAVLQKAVNICLECIGVG